MDYYTCPACGYKTFLSEPGSYEICEVCGWEDDNSQLMFVKMSGGANKLSLVEKQKENSIKDLDSHDCAKDPEWVPFDNDKFQAKEFIPGKDYGAEYPEDSIDLYYWK